MKAVSGPIMYVAPPALDQPQDLAGSKRWRSSSGVRLARAVARWHTRPVMWKSGAIADGDVAASEPAQRVITSPLWTTARGC